MVLTGVWYSDRDVELTEMAGTGESYNDDDAGCFLQSGRAFTRWVVQ